MYKLLVGWLFAAFLFAGATQKSLAAGEVRVLAAGAVQKAVAEVLREYQATGPDSVVVAYDTVGALRDRVLGGEAADVIIVSEAGLKALADKQRLWQGTQVRVGVTKVGIAVRASDPPIDISTPEKLTAVLRASPSIAHADPARGATAGTHFRKVLSALGIEADVAPRVTVVPFGGTIAKEVAEGKFALGVSQLTEIVTVPGIVGHALPAPHALETAYGYGLGREPTAATDRLIALLRGPFGQAAFRKTGF